MPSKPNHRGAGSHRVCWKPAEMAFTVDGKQPKAPLRKRAWGTSVPQKLLHRTPKSCFPRSASPTLAGCHQLAAAAGAQAWRLVLTATLVSVAARVTGGLPRNADTLYGFCMD